jgi:hypothetical protein
MNLDLTAIAEEDFGIFFTSILHQEMGDMHREIINAIMNDKRNIVIMAARGHGKTNLLSIAFPLWICWRTSSATPKMITIQSGRMELATEILKKIKQIVMTNPIVRERLMPDSTHDVKWSETQLEFSNGHRIISIPFGDSVRGFHVDYNICDDVLKDETTNVEETKKQFMAAVFPITQAKKGKHIVVGTPMSFMDLLHTLAEKPTFLALKYPAFKPDETPQFPQKFSVEQLNAIKSTQPSHLWSREYLISPVSDESALFPLDTLILPATRIDYPDLAKNEEISRQYVLGCDFAVSDKEKADFSCFVIIQIVEGRPYLFYKKELFKGMPTDLQAEKIKEMHKLYNFRKIVAEQTGLSYGIAEALLKDPNTAGVTEGFETKVKSKSEILGRLEVVMRNKQLKLPYDQSLIDELSGWTIETKDGKQIAKSVKEHDDQVMALALALYAASSVYMSASVSSVERKEAIYEKKEIREISPIDIYNPLQIIGEPSTEKPTYPDIPEQRDNYYNY